MTLVAEDYPLAIGKNTLKLQIRDATGRELPDDTTVEVMCGLPPMPGMRTKLTPVVVLRDGDMYFFSLEVHTLAQWNIRVAVQRPGGASSSATFRLDAS